MYDDGRRHLKMDGEAEDCARDWIIQSKMTLTEASEWFHLSSSQVECWIDDATRGIDKTRPTNPVGNCEQSD